MKQLFHKFPEILLVDATYNINGVGMPLYCLMVEDGFGHGRVVHYATTTEEDTEHVKEIQNISRCKTLVCQWHIMKAMFKKLVDCDIEKCERDNVRGLLHQLVYSKSAEEYEDTKNEVYGRSNKRALNHNGKDVRKCGSYLKRITMHTSVTPPI